MVCISEGSQKSLSERSNDLSLATETAKEEVLVLPPFHSTEPALHISC